MQKLIKPTDDLPTDFSVCDFETTSGDKKVKAINPRKHKILGIAGGNEKDQFYVPINHKDTENFNFDTVKRWFADWCKTNIWINQYVAFDAGFAWHQMGTKEFKGLRDLRIPAHFVNENRQSYTLDGINEQFTGEPSHKRAIIERALGKSKDYGDVPIDLTFPYACNDVAMTDRLFKLATNKIPEESKFALQLEYDLTSVLVGMECRGVKIDVKECGVKATRLAIDLVGLQEKLTTLVGIEFNPNSTAEVGDIMYNIYHIPAQKKTQKNAVSWDDEALIMAYNWVEINSKEESALTFIKLIREYKEKEKLYSSFYKPWFENNEDGRLYPRFNQIGTVTGRLSSSGPNIQNIPKPDRRVWIADDGKTFIWADYSQIEYRHFAHYAGGILREAYLENPDVDFHEWIAKELEKVVGHSVTRVQAKTFNFGIIYGMSKAKAKQQLIKVSEGKIGDEAVDRIFREYHARFTDVRKLLRTCESTAKRRGHVRNIYGRRRNLRRDEAYKAFNSLCQGGAAYITKHAMVELNKASFELTWQVHDEIGLQLDNDSDLVVESQNKIKDIMNNVAGERLSVPIRCDMEVNTKWASLDH